MNCQMGMQTRKPQEMDNLINEDNLQLHYPDFNTAWKEYKEEVKNKSKRTKLNSSPEFNQVIRECLKTIGHYWTNSTGGVYVKNMGYFTLFRPTRKFMKEGNKAYISNIHRTNGYSYLLTHINTLKPTDTFHGFKLRRASRRMKLEARRNILAGRRYTINSVLIKEHIKKKQYL